MTQKRHGLMLFHHIKKMRALCSESEKSEVFGPILDPLCRFGHL